MNQNLSRRRFFSAAAFLAATTALAPELLAQTNAPPAQSKRVAGPEFSMRISYNKEPGYRVVQVDADKLVLVTLKDGSKILAPSVAFISCFDLLPSAEELKKVLDMTPEQRKAHMDSLAPQVRDKLESMINLPQTQRDLIMMAGSNMAVDAKQVAFMMQHVVAAHGVSYDDVKKAAELCKPYFGMTNKLTAQEMQAAQFQPVTP